MCDFSNDTFARVSSIDTRREMHYTYIHYTEKSVERCKDYLINICYFLKKNL